MSSRRQEAEKAGSQWALSQRSRRPPWVSWTMQAAPCSWMRAAMARYSGMTSSRAPLICP